MAKGKPQDADAADAFAIVQAADQAVRAIESIRSRLGPKRDATAATGHLLDAILACGGTIREYRRPLVWALRHALGGESSSHHSPHAAASTVLALIAAGLRKPATTEEASRNATANGEIAAIAGKLVLCEHAIEATKALEQWDQAQTAARAAADKAAHEARLSARSNHPIYTGQGPTGAQAPRKADSAEDFALEGSVDAPGGNAFPTTPTVG